MIKLENVTKTFGNLTAVDHVSFQVEPGEILGFLGPNGAGKSTTMKMITGFLTPTSGKISLSGFDIERHPIEAKKRIGYLPEGAPAYGEMTPLSFLEFIAGIRQIPRRERARMINNAVDRIHIRNVLHQPIDTLSKGYKRRVGLAQAILHDPEVLIMDEPTDGLDPNQKQEVRHLIKEISHNKIIIISTHILEEVSAVCSRAIIIANGRLVADGKPSELEAESLYRGAITLSLPNPDEAMQALGEIDSILRIEFDPLTERVTVFPKQGVDIFDDIVELIRRQSWPMNEFHLERGRFDEVFRTITLNRENMEAVE
jgi:ABC-2 type transport system ATP-binding protein